MSTIVVPSHTDRTAPAAVVVRDRPQLLAAVDALAALVAELRAGGAVSIEEITARGDALMTALGDGALPDADETTRALVVVAALRRLGDPTAAVERITHPFRHWPAHLTQPPTAPSRPAR